MEKEAAVIARDEDNHKPRCQRRRCASARPPRGRRKQDYWRQEHGRSRSTSPPMQRRRRRPPVRNKMDLDWTLEEHHAARKFMRVVGEEILKYTKMTDEEVLEGYRVAGKLHKYNPYSEMQKRIAWVAKRYPPPDNYYPLLEEEFFRFIDDTDDMGWEISPFPVVYHHRGCRRDSPLQPCSCKALPPCSCKVLKWG